MRHVPARGLLAAALVGVTVTHAADQPCEVVPMPCTFEARPFTLTVADADGRPLADVHALAEWQVHGRGGRLDGPLMVLDAVSDDDGRLAFPGWGPVTGPVTGIGVGRDPVVTLFKSGYKTLFANNPRVPPGGERERVRRAGQDGRTYRLARFTGTPEQWLDQLSRSLGVSGRSDEILRKFRSAYLDRYRRVSAERAAVPIRDRRAEIFFQYVDRSLQLLEEGSR